MTLLNRILIALGLRRLPVLSREQLQTLARQQDISTHSGVKQ